MIKKGLNPHCSQLESFRKVLQKINGTFGSYFTTPYNACSWLFCLFISNGTNRVYEWITKNDSITITFSLRMSRQSGNMIMSSNINYLVVSTWNEPVKCIKNSSLYLKLVISIKTLIVLIFSCLICTDKIKQTEYIFLNLKEKKLQENYILCPIWIININSDF